MRIDILTLFPDSFEPLKTSICERAVSSSKVEINVINIRDYSKDKHKKCDDYTFGGGPGMLMMAQPIVDAIKSIDGYKEAFKIYMSPRGKVFSQSMAKDLSKKEHLILLCGHYEGVDQRVLDNYIDEEISVGDYVLTGGELPAMIVVDAAVRLIPGVLGGETSAEIESFEGNLLEYPQYTQPREFDGMAVPEILLSGNHKKIDEWRKEKQIEITKKNRPDLYKKFVKSQSSSKNKK